MAKLEQTLTPKNSSSLPLKRITSAFIIIFLLLLLLYRGSVFQLWLLYLVLVLVGLNEYNRLLRGGGIPCFEWSGMGCGVLTTLFFLRKGPESSGIVIMLVFVCLFLRAIFSSEDLKRSLQSLAVTFLGVFYIAYSLGHIFCMQRLANGSNMILFCLLLIWANDTGAYYVGSRYGSTKIAPTLSPGKTWEGFLGGFLLTLVAAWIGVKFMLIGGGPKAALTLAGFVSILGPVGDLAESMLKRVSGKKDSGDIVPGHGGLLDRIDSLIFCAPFFYYYCRSLV